MLKMLLIVEMIKLHNNIGIVVYHFVIVPRPKIN